MPKLNPISAKKMFRLLQKSGFQLLRVKGSHHFFFNPITGKTTTIPLHSNEDLSIGLIREVLRDIDLTIKEYEKLRRNV